MGKSDKIVRQKRSIGARIAEWWNRQKSRSYEAEPQRRVALVGSPNVGKSLIFNRLTGVYVTVSNYPGTTVEVFRGRTYIEGVLYEIIDTPGMYSLFPSSEEERVARRLLMEERPDIVVHVVDAKNLERMLPLTLQLIEADLPVVVALNMMDEAAKFGIKIDTELLADILCVPIVSVVATTGKGIEELRRVIHATASDSSLDQIRPEFGRDSQPDSKAAAR
ncbi:MAG: FeoB small GTPase domain-containing protein [Armatimonadota bacterium]|nr:50S ribosome-binding GTPase [Armatimonadota bacterium]MDW8144070.1 FeoB small GTPase domain-containing protein [Armatimonadota bacterium]